MTYERPTHLDLFSGIGGFALAAQWAGFRTVAFVEIEPYAQRVLKKNFLADPARERRQQIAGSAHGDEEANEGRSEELYHESSSLSLIHISEPTRLLSISYAVFCLKKK